MEFVLGFLVGYFVMDHVINKRCDKLDRLKVRLSKLLQIDINKL